MKGVLTFNLPEEDEEFRTAQDGLKYKLALEEIYLKVFRPLHKHGYPDPKLRELTENHPEVVEAIETLKEIYSEVLESYDVN